MAGVREPTCTPPSALLVLLSLLSDRDESVARLPEWHNVARDLGTAQCVNVALWRVASLCPVT